MQNASISLLDVLSDVFDITEISEGFGTVCDFVVPSANQCCHDITFLQLQRYSRDILLKHNAFSVLSDLHRKQIQETEQFQP